jgi:hypothetical protein
MRSRRPRSIFGRPALFRDFQPERLELIEEVDQDGEPMRRQLAALFVSSMLVTASDTVTAHHSFAMFDQENPIELEGVVQEFKYTSPHSYILLEVKGEDGSTAVWNLEGPAPSLLSRDGWSSQTLKPKDEVIMTIDPLRSGAPGGSWQSRKIKFRNGQPIMVAP